MREDGYGMSNARASVLLQLLKAEEGAAPFSTVPDERLDQAA